MSEELIEKIARAMELDHHGFPLWDGLAHETQKDWRGRARSILAAIEASGTHVVAPVEPPQEMLYAGSAQVQAVMSPPLIDTADDDAAAKIIYGAMLSARPKVTE